MTPQDIQFESPPPAESTVALRAATAADAGLIGALHAASWRSAYRGFLSDAYLESEVEQDRVTHWQARLHEWPVENRLISIAERRGQPIGFVCAECRPDSNFGVLLDNLHVLPAHQGGGVGRRLIQAVRDWARQRGATQLYLYVINENAAAIGFYERQGWTYSGMDSHHLGGKDVPVRRYLYRL